MARRRLSKGHGWWEAIRTDQGLSPMQRDSLSGRAALLAATATGTSNAFLPDRYAFDVPVDMTDTT
jgi:hypothetical protein